MIFVVFDEFYKLVVFDEFFILDDFGPSQLGVVQMHAAELRDNLLRTSFHPGENFG